MECNNINLRVQVLLYNPNKNMISAYTNIVPK